MMCHRIGLPPISTIGFGRSAVSSLSREPKPPARITTFTSGKVIRCPPRAGSGLRHDHRVRRAAGERIVALGHRQRPELVDGRTGEPEAVAGLVATGPTAADDVELDPRPTRRARLEHQQSALRRNEPAEQATVEEDLPTDARGERGDRQRYARPDGQGERPRDHRQWISEMGSVGELEGPRGGPWGDPHAEAAV